MSVEQPWLTTGARPINALADLKGEPRSSFADLHLDDGGARCFAGKCQCQRTLFGAADQSVRWAIQSWKLYEDQKFCALTSHMWEGYWLIGNRRAFARMPADLQTTANRIFNEGAERQRLKLADVTASLQKTLENEGMTSTKPDRAPFRDALAKAGFYEHWRKQFGDEAWSQLESVSGKLA